MAGLSGGGWSTTFAAAMDPRIHASFPIAGSVPCAMRNATGLMPHQNWTGDDDEDFEQSCMPLNHYNGTFDDKPGRRAFLACNYTCQYLLAGLEPQRFQVQILHEFDDCCFSPHSRHDQMRKYEADIRRELMAKNRHGHGRAGSGWFTSTANLHQKHEVSAQDKTIIRAALQYRLEPGDDRWNNLPCDVLHQPLPLHQPRPGDACAINVEPGLKSGTYLGPGGGPDHLIQSGFTSLRFTGGPPAELQEVYV
eukprot:TRINITY_DN29055_c0_g1_i1.p1 TRINITY_DN29055_c0_g1~~TRINITY_DN29055_c0_g1_i1.p1  ORF type:complete len:277 (+),score=34.50 TRINITY_DN29055_c0_g1_i1:80-832(+)